MSRQKLLVNGVSFYRWKAALEKHGEDALVRKKPIPKSRGARLFKLAALAARHTCHERFFVIEGEVVDNDGYVYKAGDFVLLKTGTQHFSTTEKGATLVVFVRELEHNL